MLPDLVAAAIRIWTDFGSGTIWYGVIISQRRYMPTEVKIAFVIPMHHKLVGRGKWGKADHRGKVNHPP